MSARNDAKKTRMPCHIISMITVLSNDVKRKLRANTDRRFYYWLYGRTCYTCFIEETDDIEAHVSGLEDATEDSREDTREKYDLNIVQRFKT
jgi:hypothetical protein